MDAGTFHTHTSAHGINAVIIALNSNLCALSRNAGNGADHDKTVMDLGHFLLKQAAQEILARA